MPERSPTIANVEPPIVGNFAITLRAGHILAVFVYNQN